MTIKDQLKRHIIFLITNDEEYIKSLIKKALVKQKIRGKKVYKEGAEMLIKLLWRQFVSDCRHKTFEIALQNLFKGL